MKRTGAEINEREKFKVSKGENALALHGSKLHRTTSKKGAGMGAN